MECLLVNCPVLTKFSQFIEYFHTYLTGTIPTLSILFGGKVYIIPKSDTLNGSQKWKDTMREFVQNTMEYLEQYHQRSNSEVGFAADKKMLG